MKKSSIEYGKSEMGNIRTVKDFLPLPSQLVLRDDNVKVTPHLVKSECAHNAQKTNKSL